MQLGLGLGYDGPSMQITNCFWESGGPFQFTTFVIAIRPHPLFEREGWYDTYAPGFVALATVDESQYFVPTAYYWWAMYFRKSVMEANGLTPPATWDELLTACDTLNANGVIPAGV